VTSSSTFAALSVRILTVSDTRTLETDRGGALIEETLRAAGHHIRDRAIVSDDVTAIRAFVAAAIAAADTDAVLITGGTGLTRRDVTPEAVAPLVTKAIPGFGELFRQLSYAEIGPSTIQSRAEAAFCENLLVFLLPGSPSAVRLALDRIIVPELDARTRPCNFAELLPRMRG
jgi:molybdenum cofactor biosynthesis protein B